MKWRFGTTDRRRGSAGRKNMWNVIINSLVMENEAVATLYAYGRQGILRKKRKVRVARKGMGKHKSELAVILKALQEIRFPCRVTLKPTQTAITDAVAQGWAAGWRERGWKTASGKPPREPELWAQILKELDKHEVKAE